MQHAQDYYPDIPEPLAVNLARGGDRACTRRMLRVPEICTKCFPCGSVADRSGS